MKVYNGEGSGQRKRWKKNQGEQCEYDEVERGMYVRFMFSIPLSLPSSILTLVSRIAGTEPDRELALPTFNLELAEMSTLGLEAMGLSACMLSRSSADI